MVTLVFDVRFRNNLLIGQVVDADLRVEIFEEGNDVAVQTRYIGVDPNSTIAASSDAEGQLYTTSVDGALLSRGQVTAKWYAKLNGSEVQPSPFTENKANVFAVDALTVTDIREYIKAMMGFPNVFAELTGTQYGILIEEALQLYGQHCPVENIAFLSTFQSTIMEYNLPQIPYTGPYDVKFVRKVVTPIASDPVFGREYLRSNQPDLGTLIMGEAYLDTALRILSSEPDWRWVHDTRNLYVSMGPGISPQIYGGYEVSVRFFDSVVLEKVPKDHHRWFKRYCLCVAKSMIGQTRSKFSGMVPAPGQPLQLNGAQLLQQADQEMDTLKNELQNMQMAVPPQFG
jgi:hypothetical protein